MPELKQNSYYTVAPMIARIIRSDPIRIFRNRVYLNFIRVLEFLEMIAVGTTYIIHCNIAL